MTTTSDLDLLSQLTTVMPGEQIRLDPEALQRYGVDWTRIFTPAPVAVVFPKTTEEVQALVRLAAAKHWALVPSGGRTGLSGGAVAQQGEIVVSFERMNQILEFIAEDRMLRVQAGVITQQVQAYAAQRGLLYPVDFASAGSSQIGGNIATNAGGIQVIRYGMPRDWVMGLKVVTGKGDLLDLNGGMMKNATGYDLRHLFIGSEGTLGCIVEATLALTIPPTQPQVMVLGVPEFAAIMALLDCFQHHLELTAFEFFSELALDLVTRHTGLNRPFPAVCPFYVLLEFDGAQPALLELAMQCFDEAMHRGWIVDGVLSQSETQFKNLWRLREDISETISRYTPYKNDISVQIRHVPAFIRDLDHLVAQHYPDWNVVWFGHIGDGNLHLNILKPDHCPLADFLQRCQDVNILVFETVKRYQGSISAEHGVGLTKKPYLSYSRSPEEIEYLKAIKQVFDPCDIMNPGKIFA